MMYALSIRQPFAWMIVRGIKDVENRTWATRYRGPLLIHAAKTTNEEALEKFHIAFANDFPGEIEPELEVGGIVGIANLTNCITWHGSLYFSGPFGFVLTGARPIPLIPERGKLNIFKISEPTEIILQDFL